MKKLIIILISLSIMSSSFCQEWEQLGSGIIDFLKTSPKTANKTNQTQAAALDAINSLLKTSSQRKHEVNVANAGRNEILINTSSGSQATMYSDINGNLYLLYNDLIYPISTSLIDQAKSNHINTSIKMKNTKTKNTTLSEYKLNELKNEYKFEKKKKYSKSKTIRYYMSSKYERLEDIAEIYNVTTDDISFMPYLINEKQSWILWEYRAFSIIVKDNDRRKYNLYETYYGKRKIRKTEFGCEDWLGGCVFRFPEHAKHMKPDGYTIHIKIKKSKAYYTYVNNIIKIFTCNWAKDFDEKGLDFEDFHGIKRSFYNKEKIIFVMACTAGKQGIWVFEIYNEINGKSVYEKEGNVSSGRNVITVEIEDNLLTKGIYIYNFKLKTPDKDIILKSEKIEIL